MVKYLVMLVLFGGFAAAQIGCEAHGKVDDDDAKVKVDIDKD